MGTYELVITDPNGTVLRREIIVLPVLTDPRQLEVHLTSLDAD